MDLFYEQVKDVIPEYDLRFAPPVGPNGGKYYCPSKVADWGVAVHNGDKKEIAMKLVDFLLSPAGAKLGSLGLRGVSYIFNDDGKVEYLGVDDDLVNTTSLLKKYGMLCMLSICGWIPDVYTINMSPKLQEAQDLVRNNSDLRVTYSKIAVTDSADEYNRIYSEIDKEHKIMITKIYPGSGRHHANLERLAC
jgi:putative aldouronate transport system substrate-binding protein